MRQKLIIGISCLAVLLILELSLSLQKYHNTYNPEYAKSDSYKESGPLSSGPIFLNIVKPTYVCLGHWLSEFDKEIVAGATILIFLVTSALAIYTALLWGATKNLVERSEKSTRTIERAYVKMSHKEPGVRVGTGFGEVTFEIKNWGRTPATATDVRAWAKLLEHGEFLPEEFPYPPGPRQKVPTAFLVTQEAFYTTQTFPLIGDNRKDTMDSQKRLWVFGHVDYIDAFGDRYRSGYVRIYEPHVDDGRQNNLVYMTEGTRHRYNYDRPRKKGEGNDWT